MDRWMGMKRERQTRGCSLAKTSPHRQRHSTPFPSPFMHPYFSHSFISLLPERAFSICTLSVDGWLEFFVCVDCSLPTEAEQSSVITQTLSWPSLLLSSTLNGGVCVYVWADVCVLNVGMWAASPVCVSPNHWSPPGVNCYGCCLVEITVICFL